MNGPAFVAVHGSGPRPLYINPACVAFVAPDLNAAQIVFTVPHIGAMRIDGASADAIAAAINKAAGCDIIHAAHPPVALERINGKPPR